MSAAPGAAAAADPSTPAETLAWIAQNQPDLHAVLASNPGLYPELRQWLGQSPDPAVQQALQQFAQAQALAMSSLAAEAPPLASAAAQPGAVGMEPPPLSTVGGNGGVSGNGSATGTRKAARIKIAFWVLGGITVCAAIAGGLLYWDHASSADTDAMSPESGAASQSADLADEPAPVEPTTPPEEPSTEQAAETDNSSETIPVEEVPAEPSWADLDGRWVSSNPADPGQTEVSGGGARVVFDDGFAYEASFIEASGECFSGSLQPVDSLVGGAQIVYCPAGAEPSSNDASWFVNSDPARDRWAAGQDPSPQTVWYRAD